MSTSLAPTGSKGAPFLKWAGGKQRLLRQYQPYFPKMETVARYYEPFIGSAAVFFHLQPAQATLADRNEKLIELYTVVRDQVEALIRALKGHKNDADYYYAVRAQDPAQLTAVARAARLIFLNKTCYNGLYRENSRGQFNVPFGRYKNPKICDKKRLRAAAAALQGVTLVAADFETAVAAASANDFIYFDPPYVPLNATSSFTSYHQLGFDATDQQRLAECVQQLTEKGCRVMLSNSSAALVEELYANKGYRLLPIQARRNINSKGNRRGPVKELLILNY